MLSSKQQAGRILPALISLALLVAVALAPADTCAQNLVPNPGFESCLTCPTTDFQFDGYVANWKSTTRGGSPDYFNARNNNLCSQGVPATRYGFRSAHDSASGGAAFAGIYCTNIGINYREYIGVPLTAPLRKGDWYTVRFFASLAQASTVGIMNLGAYIGHDPAVSSNYVYPATPQLRYPQFLTTNDGWVEISGLYQATGGENYLMIGCFDEALRTTPVKTGGACSDLKYSGAYYFIDDVSLTPAAPSCFNSSEYYDITFQPDGTSSLGECCWNVVVSGRKDACPLYGVNAFLPSGTMPFTWRTDTPVMPGETRTIGRFCMGGPTDPGIVFVSYLNQLGAPMSGATRELRCGAPAAALAVRAVPFDPGSTDYCSYDLYVDNPTGAGVPLRDLALAITGGEFSDGVEFDWALNGEPGPRVLRWHGPAAGQVVRANGTLHIGRFSVAHASGPERITASLYQHPAADGGDAEQVVELPLNCTIGAGECYATLHADLLPGQGGEKAASGCYVINIWREPSSSCAVASVAIANATPDIPVNWQPYQLPSPLDLNGAGRDVGTLCYDLHNPPDLSITYYDAAGTPICVQRLLTSHVGQLQAHVGSPAGAAAARPGATLDIAPNPARGGTSITYRIERDGPIRMELFDMSGKLVADIAAGNEVAGEHTLRYDAAGIPPGTYRIRMTSSSGGAALATLVVVR